MKRLFGKEKLARDRAVVDEIRRGAMVEDVAEKYGLKPRGVSGYCQIHGVPTAGQWRSRKAHRSPSMSIDELVEWALTQCISVDNGCLLWTGFVNENGYGRVRLGGKLVFLHRLVYENHHKIKLNKIVCICHVCDTPGCVNIRHLWAGSNLDNVADREAKGRNVVKKGEENSCSILKEREVREIRDILSSGAMNGREIGNAYGVHHSTIHLIKKNKNWAHVK